MALAYCSCLSVFCLLSIPFSSCFSLSLPLLPLPVGKLIYRPSAIVNHSLSCTLGAGVGVRVGVGVAAPPFFFDTIKFPCRLILNARRILIIFIENALWNSSAPQLRSGVLSCLTHSCSCSCSFAVPLSCPYRAPSSAVANGSATKGAGSEAERQKWMSFIQSFIPSLAFAIPVHFAHAIKPGIGPDSPQLHFLSSSHSLLPPHLCEPVKLITIYIVYRLVLRFALSLSLSLFRSLSSPPN